MTRSAARSVRDRLAAIAVLAAAPAAAEPVPAYSLETIARVPTAQLALQLLAPEDAADIESHRVHDGGMMQWLSGVSFFHRARPIAADICGQAYHQVAFYPIATAPDQPPPQIVAQAGPIISGISITLAPDCRLAAGQGFAQVNPGLSQEVAVNALRAIAAARAVARGTGELPFSFTCADELGQGECGSDGREALAGLPIELAFLIEADRNRTGWIRMVIGAPRRPIWELHFPGGADMPTDLVMTWKAPAPF